MRKTYILIFIILVMLVAVIAGGIACHSLFYGKQRTIQSNMDVSLWKTYRNEELGLEMKYPTDWFVSGNVITSYNPKTVTDDKLQEFIPFRAKFEFYLELPCPFSYVECLISIEDFAARHQGVDELPKIMSKSYIVQDGVQGVVIEEKIYDSSDLELMTIVYFVKGSKGYIFYYFGDHNFYFREIFKVFISTIRFID